MMLAAELALAKVDVAIVERRPDHVLVGSRAGGFHSRTVEGARPAWRRRSLPRGGTGGASIDDRHDAAGQSRPVDPVSS